MQTLTGIGIPSCHDVHQKIFLDVQKVFWKEKSLTILVISILTLVTVTVFVMPDC